MCMREVRNGKGEDRDVLPQIPPQVEFYSYENKLGQNGTSLFRGVFH